MSKHGEERVRERCGVPKRAVKGVIEKAYTRGIERVETTGDIRRLLDSIYIESNDLSAIKLYNEKVWVFGRESSLLTVFELSSCYKNTYRKILRRKNGKEY